MKNILILALATVAVAAHAQYFSDTVLASNNATVQPAGPRTGSNGKNFFNIEGSANASFASYGVIDFTGNMNFAPFVTKVTGLSVMLTESNAAFTKHGTLRFWVTADTTTNIDPGTSPLIYDAAQAPSGLQTDKLLPRYDLGTGLFTTDGNVNSGQVDTYTFAVSGAASDLLTDAALTHKAIRLLITPETSDVAATWAGFSNTTRTGPQLKLEGVPEPATMTVLGMGALALIRRRKSK